MPPSSIQGPLASPALRHSLEDFDEAPASSTLRYQQGCTFRPLIPGVRRVDRYLQYMRPLAPLPDWIPGRLRPALQQPYAWWQRLHVQPLALPPLTGVGAPAALDLVHLPAILQALPAAWLAGRVTYLGANRFVVLTHDDQPVHVQGGLPAGPDGAVRGAAPQSPGRFVPPTDATPPIDMTYATYEQAWLKLAGLFHEYGLPSLLLPPPWRTDAETTTLRHDALCASMQAITGSSTRRLDLSRQPPDTEVAGSALRPAAHEASIVLLRHPNHLAQQPGFDPASGSMHRSGLAIRPAPWKTPSLSLHGWQATPQGGVEGPCVATLLAGIPYTLTVQGSWASLTNPLALAANRTYADPATSLARADVWSEGFESQNLSRAPQPADFPLALQAATDQVTLPLEVLPSIVEAAFYVGHPAAAGPPLPVLQHSAHAAAVALDSRASRRLAREIYRGKHDADAWQVVSPFLQWRRSGYSQAMAPLDSLSRR